MQRLTKTVYDSDKLIDQYIGPEMDLGFGRNVYAWGCAYAPSPEQNFVYSRVTHEHAIFKRHTINVLKIVGPVVAYACLRYLEVSVPMKMLSAFVLGNVGGKVVGEVLCAVYKLLNLAAGSFISHKYDAYGHWDFLAERKPYLCAPKDCLKFLFAHFIVACIISVLIILTLKI